MLFDTGAHGIGMVEVDYQKIGYNGNRFGKKDEGTDHAVTYMVSAKSGLLVICRTVGIADRSPEARERGIKQLQEICSRITPRQKSDIGEQ